MICPIAAGAQKAAPRANNAATTVLRVLAPLLIRISFPAAFTSLDYPILMIYVIIFRYCPVNESEVVVNWERLARANTHPLRVSILEVLNIDNGRTLSPKDLSLELQAPLSTVNYHVTELRRSNLVEVVDERQVRGAIEHFYRSVESSENGSKPKKGRKATRKARV
jgi:hypothetical protein